jgi:hypothetical protein
MTFRLIEAEELERLRAVVKAAEWMQKMKPYPSAECWAELRAALVVYHALDKPPTQQGDWK